MAFRIIVGLGQLASVSLPGDRCCPRCRFRIIAAKVSLLVAKAVSLLDVVGDGGLVVGLILGHVVGLRVGGDADDLLALRNFWFLVQFKRKNVSKGSGIIAGRGK